MGHTILAWITQAWAPSLGYILYVYIIIVLKTTLWSRSYDPILQKNELSIRENKLLSKLTQFKNDQIVTEHTRVCHFDSLLNCTKLFHIVSESPAPGAMAPHSSPLAWKIPWAEEPGRLQSMGSLQLDTTERLHFHFSLSCIGEGNGNPLQCSCLENPRDGEAWWTAVYGVAQSRTRLRWLSSSSSSSFVRGFLKDDMSLRVEHFFHKYSLAPQYIDLVWSKAEESPMVELERRNLPHSWIKTDRALGVTLWAPHCLDHNVCSMNEG